MMEPMKILIKEEHEPEFLPVHQDESFVKEEPDMSLYNVTVKDEFPMINDTCGLGDWDDDPLSIQFSERNLEPVMSYIGATMILWLYHLGRKLQTKFLLL